MASETAFSPPGNGALYGYELSVDIGRPCKGEIHHPFLFHLGPYPVTIHGNTVLGLQDYALP